MKWLDDLKRKWNEAMEEATSPKISLNTAQAIVADFFQRTDDTEDDGLALIADANAEAAEANKILAKAAVKRSKGTRKVDAVKRVRKAMGPN